MEQFDPHETGPASSSGAGDPQRVVVILPQLRAGGSGGLRELRSPEATLAEAVGLAEAISLEVVKAAIVPVGTPRPATLFGGGKVEEIGATVKAEGAGLVVVDHPLSPVQQRNLERAWGAKVLDRTALILEIFGERARTKEGALQVELAHLTWQKSRLVRSWTHLERQRGGFGFLGGPGETQLEADRRLIEGRIARVERDLEDVRRTRALHRTQRRRSGLPLVALVGYTNAGKSTLFNALSAAGVDERDLLFATLDPTVRRVGLPHGDAILLSDTVGFISQLPTHLIAAFRATLEEVVEADLILHVRDISHPDTLAQAQDVRETLEALGADPFADDRILEVWNKIDLVGAEATARLGNEAGRRAVPVSARTGEGIGALLAAIEERLHGGGTLIGLALPAAEGALLAWLYRNAEIIERRDADGIVRLTVRANADRLEALRDRCGPYITVGEGRRAATA